MNNFKFKINKEGYYIGYGSDGTISMDDKFNLNNLPTYEHYYDFKKSKWVLSSKAVKSKNIADICKELDLLSDKIIYNKVRYGNLPKYAESYKAKKDELIKKQDELTTKLEELTK